MNKLSLIIYIIHSLICFVLVFGWVFKNNKEWLDFLILFSIFIQLSYLLMDGCILTKLDWIFNEENKKKKMTIVTPVINFCKLDNKLSNRQFITGLFVNSGLLNTFIVRMLL